MDELSIPALPCMCASLRRAARALTQMYEEELRAVGLRATQFTVLQALAAAGEITQGELGRILAIDSTTLTRTLEIMGRHGWINRRRGTDRREWRLGLSSAGKDQVRRATSRWEKAQARLQQRLGERRWNELLKMSADVTVAAIQSGDLS